MQERLMRAGLFVAGAAVVLVFVWLSATSDDCWNGALSDDPLHCYVLEQAQRDGIIDVDAVYSAGGVLHFYLKEGEPARGDIIEYMGDIFEYIRQKAQEEVRRSGGDDCVLSSDGCRIGVFSPPGWDSYWHILPVSEVYETIELRFGGADARYSEPGWASYRQVWPASDGGVGGASGSGALGFDVSDVDTTNFPPVDCSPEYRTSCNRSQEIPGIGLAGWRSMGGGSGRMVYIQVKSPPGHEVTAATNAPEALQEALLRWNPGMDLDRVVVIPVKYDYEELWRWVITLRRFARSSSNTVGIVRALVGTNRISGYVGKAVYTPESSLQEVPRSLDDFEAGENIRETIHVSTLDLDRTMNALPEVLSQLGIPADAVGAVVQIDRTPQDPGIPGVPELSANPSSVMGSIGSGVEETASEFFARFLIGGAAALAALGSVVLVIVRLLRRR